MDFIKNLKERHGIYLNEQQQKAVVNIDGPILLLAVPGGGKTTVIVSRCANMVINHGIKPENILTLTFSKASALDMKHRFRKVFGNEVNSELHFSTIHSFCYNVLKTYTNKKHMAFPVIIEDERAPVTKSQLLRQLYQQFNQAYLNDDKLDELSNSICYVKNMMFSEREISSYKPGVNNFSEILNNYEKYKRQNNYIDFDDLLTRTLDLFCKNEEMINFYRNKYTYINVDESQDTSYLQHQIIKHLANPRNNIFMVGDEDQSIYTFRAAFPKALLEFESTYPGAQVYLMEKNYRSTKSIVTAANIFIKQNNERYDKNMFSEKDEGIPVTYKCVKSRNEQYTHIISSMGKERDFSSTAVLYRNNISTIPLADALDRGKIPFYMREAKTHFFKHWVTTDIISFIDLSIDGTSIEAFKQIYYKMNAYISKAMFEYAAGSEASGRNVFDILLEYPDLNVRYYGRLAQIKQNIGKISKLKALAAIEFIVGTLEYGEYLKKQSGEGADSADSLSQVISGLKSIAAKAGDIEGFKSRLAELQQIMDNARFNKGRNAVTLSTIHSSKGLEFDRVFIIDLYDGQFPSSGSIIELKDGDRRLMEEEVRLFYVGATRARKHLELMASDTLDGKKVKPSRFIEKFLRAYSKQTEKARNKKSGAGLEEYIGEAGITEEDLYTDTPVIHKKFGQGTIRFINPKFDLLEIYFPGTGLKTLSLKTCIRGNIIRRPADTDKNTTNAQNEPKSGNMNVEELRELALSIGKTGIKKEILPELFRHPDYEVRRRACSAANKLKDAEITRHIAPCLNAQEPQIRQYALKAVLSSKCKEVIEQVREVGAREDKDYNRRLCEAILKRMAR